jgi:hypothetical protein
MMLVTVVLLITATLVLTMALAHSPPRRFASRNSPARRPWGGATVNAGSSTLLPQASCSTSLGRGVAASALFLCSIHRAA